MKDTLDRITREAKAALGDNLVSLVLYGSHARGEAHPHSDINLFVVVRDHRPDALRPLLKLIPQWQKQRIAVPVIFRADQLARAFDSFSIEFVEMAAARQVLHGEDPFANFTPDWSSVRRELEREARQKLIALMRRWLAAGGDLKHYPRILADTVPGYLTLLRSTVLLERRSTESTTLEEALLLLSAREGWFKADLWRRLHEAAKRKAKVPRAELPALMHDYLEQAIALVKAIDEMG
jgi:predicted nucleotidyltransferase